MLDLTRETDATRKLYCLDNPITSPFGTRCLMARRLVESGVQFVEIFSSPGQPWDHHSKIKTGPAENLRQDKIGRAHV